MAGQFSDLEKKSIEPIALAIKDGNVLALQRFVSDAPWDDDKMEFKYRNLVNDDLGSPDGALIFDESGFVKKGDNSVGVARQYCGTIGKVDNCQVGVFAGYASEHGYALVDKRLYVPEKWFTEILNTNSKPTRLDELARNINNYFWYQRKVSEGTKVPIVYEFTRRRVILSGEGLPQKTVWVLIRRTIGKKPWKA